MSDDNCLDATSRDSPVKLVRCHGMGGNQAWNYSEEVKQKYCVILHREWKLLTL